jgi:iron(III) transport system permease protein
VLLTVVVLALEARSAGRAARGGGEGGDRLARRGAIRRLAPVPLGRWRWVVVGLLGTFLALALVVPLVVVGWWLVRGLVAGQPIDPAVGAAVRTVGVAATGAVVATVAAFPIALWSARDASRLARVVERTSYLGYALPGIVVAFALVYVGIRATPILYQTIGMLIVAYVVLFLPQAAGAIRTSLLQVEPDVDAAARTLGARPTEVVRRVLVPLARGGAVSGATLVFLTIVKELPATLLLSPTGFDTLAVRVWSATEEAFYARAALPALLLVLIGSLPLAATMVRQERRERRDGRLGRSAGDRNAVARWRGQRGVSLP